MNWISALVSALANLIGWRREVAQRKNTEEQRANQTALDTSKANDVIAASVDKAVEGDAKALEDVRKDWAE